MIKSNAIVVDVRFNNSDRSLTLTCTLPMFLYIYLALFTPQSVIFIPINLIVYSQTSVMIAVAAPGF